MCMGEHTWEVELPHIKQQMCKRRKVKQLGRKAALFCAIQRNKGYHAVEHWRGQTLRSLNPYEPYQTPLSKAAYG